MAELLVKAKPHWKDSWNQTKINSLSENEKRHYNARSQIGDIIVVKQDGWNWGKEERLPNFIVIKISNFCSLINSISSNKFEYNVGSLPIIGIDLAPLFFNLKILFLASERLIS